MDLIELIRGKKVMVGLLMWQPTISKRQRSPTFALLTVDAENLYPCTNCGDALSRQVATGKLRALSAGAEIVRKALKVMCYCAANVKYIHNSSSEPNTIAIEFDAGYIMASFTFLLKQLPQKAQ